MSAVVPTTGPVGSVRAAGEPAVGAPDWWADAAAYAYAKHDQEVLDDCTLQCLDKEELPLNEWADWGCDCRHCRWVE